MHMTISLVIGVVQHMFVYGKVVGLHVLSRAAGVYPTFSDCQDKINAHFQNDQNWQHWPSTKNGGAQANAHFLEKRALLNMLDHACGGSIGCVYASRSTPKKDTPLVRCMVLCKCQ